MLIDDLSAMAQEEKDERRKETLVDTMLLVSMLGEIATTLRALDHDADIKKEER